jgi:outer membrane protein assembly factor BamB
MYRCCARSCYLASLVSMAQALLVADTGIAGAVGWRGDGSGVFADATPATNWAVETGFNVAWRTPVKRWSNGSPIVISGKVFVTAEPNWLVAMDAATGAIAWERETDLLDLPNTPDAGRLKEMKRQRTEAEAEVETAERQIEDLRAATEDASKQKADGLKERVRALKGTIKALDEQLGPSTGERGVRWNRSVGYSIATPVSDGRRVWVRFGTGAVVCYDLDGNRQWLKRVDYDGTETAAPSPLLCGAHLVLAWVPFDANRTYRNEKTDRRKVFVALKAEDGSTAWQTPPLRNAGWGSGSPIQVRLGDTPTVVTDGGDVIRAADGKILASEIGIGGASTAVAGGNVVFLCDDKAIAAVELTLRGDTATAKELWKTTLVTTAGGSYGVWSSPLLLDGLIYAVEGRAEGFVLDAKTGQLLHKFLPLHPQTKKAECYSSLAYAGGHIFVGDSKKGYFGIVHPGRDARVVALTPPLGETINSSPFFAGNRLYLRTQVAVYCIGEK